MTNNDDPPIPDAGWVQFEPARKAIAPKPQPLYATVFAWATVAIILAAITTCVALGLIALARHVL